MEQRSIPRELVRSPSQPYLKAPGSVRRSLEARETERHKKQQVLYNQYYLLKISCKYFMVSLLESYK